MLIRQYSTCTVRVVRMIRDHNKFRIFFQNRELSHHDLLLSILLAVHVQYVYNVRVHVGPVQALLPEGTFEGSYLY